MANVKISQLPNINGNLTANSLLPVVSTNGTFITDKVNVSNLANYILGESGNTFASGNISNLAYNVINASQPNITTVGTLTGLTVVGTTNVGYPNNFVMLGGTAGQVLATFGDGSLGWVDQVGASGPIGPDGATGATGLTGATGPEGPPGPASTIGATGPEGATGPAGAAGADGATGATGVAGADGSTGATGASGPGFVWTGPWNPSGYYIGGQDVVSYAGSSYIKIGDGNSGSAPPDDPIRWSVMAEEGAVGAVGATGPAGPVAGFDTTVIFNDGGVAAGTGGLLFDKNTGNLSVAGGWVNAAAVNATGRIEAGTTITANGAITTYDTGTAINAGSGNILTNQVTGTGFNFLNGLYTASLTGQGATSNYQLNLPSDAGINGQVLSTDGTGNLSWITAGGGGGNTGNVTFSDQVVQGTGDEYGGSGLYLAPGANSTANLQFLRVRGGDYPTHIHLDTGNNNYFDQYFGADFRYVKLEANGNIVINADDDNGNSATWTFDTTGNLVLAGGNSVIQSIANSSLDPTNPNVSTMTLTPDANYNGQALVLDPTAPGHIHLRSHAYGSNIDEPLANLFLGGENTAFEITSGSNNVAKIHSGNLTWTFSNNSGASVIDLPGESYIRSNQDTVNIQSLDANGIGRGIYIGTNGTLYFWDGNSQSVSIQQDNTNANITAIGNARITSNVSTWTFGTDGTLLLPRDAAGNTDPYLWITGGNAPSITSVDVSLGGPANFQIVSDYLNLSGYSGAKVAIKADNGEIATDANMVLTTNNSNVGNTYSWTFDTTGNFNLANGNSVIQSVSNNAGDGSGLSTLNLIPDNSTGDDRYLIIDPTGPAHLHLRAGGAQDASNVLLYLGGEQTYVQVDDGYHRVTIGSYDASNTTGYNWRFDYDGNLVLPLNTFAVKYADGTQVPIVTSASGFNNQIQFNSNGAFGASANYKFTDTVGGGSVEVGNELLLLGNGTISTSSNNLNIQPAGNLVVTSSIYNWTFDLTGNLTLPGNTFAVNYANGSQASAPLVDILNTNGLTTVFYPTFVENRTDGQIVRADVDLSYRSDTNTLTVGNISTNNITSGNITAAVGASPAPYLTGFSTITAVDRIGTGNANLYSNGLFSGNTATFTGNVTAGNVYANSGTVSAANLVLNGQEITASGIVNASYLFAINNSNQTGLAANGAVAFQTTQANNGSLINKISNTQVTLTGNNTYRLEGIIKRNSSDNTWSTFQWYDVTNGAYVGGPGFGEAVTSGQTGVSSTIVATAYVTPSTNTTYELRSTVNTVTVNQYYASMEITQINPALVLGAISSLGVTGNINVGGSLLVNGNVAVNGPAFSAYQASTGTALNSSGSVKLNFDAEDFDTNNNFDLTTDRFTPTVAGYYQVTVSTMIPNSSLYVSSSIYKNGSKVCDGQAGTGGGSFYGQSIASKLIYMNGTTDYLEAYAIATGSVTTFPSASGVGTYFQASMVRGA